jgi:hypothetical protein
MAKPCSVPEDKQHGLTKAKPARYSEAPKVAEGSRGEDLQAYF